MPFSRPTLSQLLARTAQQVAGRLGLGGLLPRSRLGALATAVAGASHEVHGYADWIARQVFPDTAEAAELERWAAIWAVSRLPATAWSATVLFTGTNGSVIPEGTALQRDDGAQYLTQALATIAGGEAEVLVEAVDVGSASNVAAGATLRLVQPIAGVQTAATVQADELVDGADQEDDEALRQRVLERLRLRPHGGAQHDYPAWALEVPGVTRAWAFALWMGPGTVGVTFARDDDDDGPIPDAGEVAEVQAYIDERRPVTADVTVFAPLAREIDATIALVPDTQALRDAVTTALADLLRREAAPGATLLISHVREAISTTPGEEDHVIELWDGEEPADVELEQNELGMLGTITWA